CSGWEQVFPHRCRHQSWGTISNDIRTFAEFKDTPRSSSLQAEIPESTSEKSEVLLNIVHYFVDLLNIVQ
ncbi:hypothetical protein, partial [Faecalibaculum rodentium]|uniref:hypothetical protein n=1 Tax=Faecalibaculum rodentium TaxID=1702221 RepID=UPI00260D2016